MSEPSSAQPPLPSSPANPRPLVKNRNINFTFCQEEKRKKKKEERKKGRKKSRTSATNTGCWRLLRSQMDARNSPRDRRSFPCLPSPRTPLPRGPQHPPLGPGSCSLPAARRRRSEAAASRASRRPAAPRRPAAAAGSMLPGRPPRRRAHGVAAPAGGAGSCCCSCCCCRFRGRSGLPQTSPRHRRPGPAPPLTDCARLGAEEAALLSPPPSPPPSPASQRHPGQTRQRGGEGRGGRGAEGGDRTRTVPVLRHPLPGAVPASCPGPGGARTRLSLRTGQGGPGDPQEPAGLGPPLKGDSWPPKPRKPSSFLRKVPKKSPKPKISGQAAHRPNPLLLLSFAAFLLAAQLTLFFAPIQR